MKFRPTACWRMRTSPAAGAGTSTFSYTRASGPPTLCTRTALVMTISPSVLAKGARPGCKRKPSPPRCQLTVSNRLFDDLPAITPGEHIEQFDRRRKQHGKVDIASRDVELESVCHQRHPDQHQERQRQHLGGGMIGDEFGNRP